VLSKYILDLYSVTNNTLKSIIADYQIKGRILIHTAFFKHTKTVEELKSFSEAVSEITELVNGNDELYVELTNHLPKGLSFEDFENNKNHFLLTLAIEMGATIITGDESLYEISKASNISCIYVKPTVSIPSFTKYFEDDVMSLHLKEGTYPFVKKGKPGSWELERVGEKILTRSDLEALTKEIYEIAKASYEQVREIDRKSSLIAQLGNYRIVLTKPPLSDGIEVTIVRPTKSMRIEDYNITPKLLERLEKQAEGILIAGAPGMGKTTFAQALAEFYHRKNKIVKTLESPRDMVLPAEITQLSKTHGTSEELHDVLLLSRPDYTIFDEMRDTKDFEMFTDLRLAGIGMVGVVHATTPIDAIQRFINRVELGMIPSIIDTVIFIKYGEIKETYTLETSVRIPHGLTEADLTRPVVLVKDLETEEPLYEIYVFGERTFVVPIKKESKDGHIKNVVLSVIKKYAPASETIIEKKGEKYILKVPVSYYSRIQHKASRKLEKIANKYDIELQLIPI
jgi:ATPase (PilT family)